MTMTGNSHVGAATGNSYLPQGQAAPAAYRLSLLGPFELAGPNGEVIEIPPKKNRLLMAMVAQAPHRSMSRDVLAQSLWAEYSDEQARNSLRQALAVLRKDLNGHHEALFASLDSTVALQPKSIVLDTEMFLSDIRLGDRQSLERAVRLWRGPFLADITAPEPGLEQWLSERREFFHRQYIAAMDLLVPLLDGEARITLETSTETCWRPTRVKGSFERANSLSATAPRSVVKS